MINEVNQPTLLRMMIRSSKYYVWTFLSRFEPPYYLSVIQLKTGVQTAAPQ